MASPPAPSGPTFPSVTKWSVVFGSAPVAAPLAADDRVLLALRGGPLMARRLADGGEIWTRPLAADQPLDVDAGQLFVVAQEVLHALNASDGTTVWQRPVGLPSAPIVARGGWVIISSKGSVTALRAADGTQVWTKDVGAASERAAIDGGAMYLPLADGHLLALDLTSGEERWRQPVGPSPTAPFVYGDRIYLGSSGKRFVCLKAATGEEEWGWSIGSRVIGTAAADARHIYVVAQDNVLRALSRSNGNQRWKQALRYRPSAGPVVLGPQVGVPGMTATLMGVAAATGKSTGTLTFAAGLAIGPAFVPPGADETPPVVVAVTGGLISEWTLVASVPVPSAPAAQSSGPVVKLPQRP